MTLLERLKIRIPEEENDALLNEVLETAREFILTHMYPLEDDVSKYLVPLEYNSLQLDIAVELYNKRGAEGEVAHSENGVSRTYDSASVSAALTNRIIPRVKVIGSSGGDNNA